jgi:DNA-binding NarL/FixJ family response regulator
MMPLETTGGWFARSRLQELAVEAALENIPKAALIVTATGAVERSNARARALIDSDREQVLQSLRQSLNSPGPSAEFEISPLFTYGNVAHYLAVQRSQGAAVCDRLALSVHRWRLTAQEARVFGHLVNGDSNRQIAAKLSCAERTVELHVTHILQRLDVENRSAAIAKFWTQP